MDVTDLSEIVLQTTQNPAASIPTNYEYSTGKTTATVKGLTANSNPNTMFDSGPTLTLTFQESNSFGVGHTIKIEQHGMVGSNREANDMCTFFGSVSEQNGIPINDLVLNNSDDDIG
jgi:hypothetical protein